MCCYYLCSLCVITHVKPHLENCIQAWSPRLQKDIQYLESVQRAATKLVPCLWNLSYEKRLQALRLTSLWAYDRRLTRDLIETYKILSCFDRSHFISFSNCNPAVIVQEDTAWSSKSRGQDLIHEVFFFSQRVVQHWNSLPQSVTDATSVTSFKRCLDNYTRYGQIGQ